MCVCICIYIFKILKVKVNSLLKARKGLFFFFSFRYPFRTLRCPHYFGKEISALK